MRLLTMIFILLPTVAAAQVPPKLGYQGRLLKADGKPQTGTVPITFSVLPAETGGAALWTETQPQVALTSDGFFSTVLGEVVAIGPGVFNGSERFLEVNVNGTALSPRQRINSVAYALMSTDARNVVGGTVDAASIRVGGNPVIDGAGKLVGTAAYAAGSGISLSNNTISLMSSCMSGEILRWNGTSWACSTAGASSYAAAPGGGLALVGSSGTSFTLLTTCSPGQLLKWTGSPTNNWACAVDDDSGGSVTAVSARAPLTSSGGSSPQIGLSSAGCSGGQVLEWTGTAWACALDDDSGGTVTAVSATAPLTSSGGLTPQIGISGAGCNAGQVLEWTGMAWACAADDNSLGTVTAVTATGPLASTGGATPNITLAGVVGLSNGGTGASLATTGGAGQYVKQSTAGGPLSVGALAAADLPAGSGQYIQNQAASAQPASLNISGTAAVGGTLGVGTATPTVGTKLDVVGKLRLSDGTEGAGRVLTSDGNGVGTWATPGATVPAGMVAFFNLTACPTGWSPLVAAQGRYVVGVSPANATAPPPVVGTELGNLENRPVGQHNHAINDPGHTHPVKTGAVTSGTGLTVFVPSTPALSNTEANTTGITTANAGAVAGTNAPYIQLLVCQKT